MTANHNISYYAQNAKTKTRGNEPIMNSIIFKELSQPEIEKIVTDLYGSGTQLRTCRILKGGLFNTSYLLGTDRDAAEIVLRVAPVNPHLLFEYEKDMMAAEPLFHALLAEHDIPTSRVIKYAQQGAVIDREYIISAYIPSIPMNDPSLEGQNLDYIYAAVGALTRRLHGIRGEKFGWKRPTRTGASDTGEYDSWAAFLRVFAGEAAAKAGEHALFSRADIDVFEALFSVNAPLFDEITEPHMAHTDLWQGNILLSERDGGYYVSAIIDLDRTIFGDVHWDLATPWLTTADFWRGYGDRLPEDAAGSKRVMLYKLLNHFFAAYVTIVQYRDPEWFEREKADALKVLRAVETMQ